MPDFKVRGQSIVDWEVLIEAEDGDSAAEMAKDLLEDEITVEIDADPSISAEVVGQRDRVLRVNPLTKPVNVS